MTNEQAKKMADEALDRLMDELEAGKSEALKAYLAVMGRFHRYSWGNALLIDLQRPRATHVAGFQAWRKLGRRVRKREKGILILAPMVVKKEVDAPDGQERRPAISASLAIFSDCRRRPSASPGSGRHAPRCRTDFCCIVAVQTSKRVDLSIGVV